MEGITGSERGVNPSPLPRYLLAAYIVLIVYASLYPWRGWQAHGASPIAYLTAAWPRWMTSFDLAANVLAYLPLGALGVWSGASRWGTRSAVAVSVLVGVLVSAVLEAAQSYLPVRVASNVDLITNASGALLGALLGARALPWLRSTQLLHWLRGMQQPAGEPELGLTLLALWLFAQLNPASLLFGTGDLRDLLVGATGVAYDAGLFVHVEALTAAANLLAVSLLASGMVADAAPVRRLLLALLVAALGVKALAFAILVRPENAFAWLTPGAQSGLLAGIALMLGAVVLPRAARLALAAVFLMGATVLVNLAPPNPYTVATLKVWAQGHFLNFNGLTQFVSSAWPFAALAYLMRLAARRERAQGSR